MAMAYPMETNEEEFDYDTFCRWDVPALKTYLRKRGQSTVGRKTLLIARAFAAYELKLPLIMSQSEREVELEKEYKSLLKTCDEGPLPDPMYDLDDWLPEREGMKNWPPTYIEDISVYLAKHETRIEKVSLTKRLLCDYKEQKAYSYFSSKFLFEIFYNKISDTSNYCFLKAKCTPAQRIKDIPHDSWAMVNKHTGEINAAYCTCFAGLGQSCNHIAALLLKVDFCWKFGDVQRACTSQPCAWVTTNKAVKVAPMKAGDFVIRKPSAESKEKKRTLNCARKKLFNPNKEKGMTLQEFLDELNEISPDSVTLGERKPIRNQVYENYDQQNREKRKNIFSFMPSVPENIADIALKFTSVDSFLMNLPIYTEGEVSNIEKATRGQSESEIWFHQRKGRITASKFHDVFTRMETYKKNPSTKCDNTLRQLMGYNSPPYELKALKYGRRMESEAICAYEHFLMQNGHKNVTVRRCGLFVHKEITYIGATPDSMISCECCGSGVLEVKCPLTSSHVSPSPETVNYLQTNEKGHVVLKPKHKYFTQVQGQMALTGTRWCDFFVFSKHGYIFQRIVFDPDFWLAISSNLIFFFTKFLAEELVTRKLQMQCSLTNSQDAKQIDVMTDFSAPEHSYASTSNDKGTVIPKHKSKGRITKGKSIGKYKKSLKPIYLCGFCKRKCEDITDELESADFSIYCNKCSTWFHWGCVDISENSTELENEEYLCPTCK